MASAPAQAQTQGRPLNERIGAINRSIGVSSTGADGVCLGCVRAAAAISAFTSSVSRSGDVSTSHAASSRGRRKFRRRGTSLPLLVQMDESSAFSFLTTFREHSPGFLSMPGVREIAATVPCSPALAARWRFLRNSIPRIRAAATLLDRCRRASRWPREPTSRSQCFRARRGRANRTQTPRRRSSGPICGGNWPESCMRFQKDKCGTWRAVHIAERRAVLRRKSPAPAPPRAPHLSPGAGRMRRSAPGSAEKFAEGFA
jgi:hypothetical protein